jgi:type II secretory pathway component GspD/PulD (secretin)
MVKKKETVLKTVLGLLILVLMGKFVFAHQQTTKIRMIRLESSSQGVKLFIRGNHPIQCKSFQIQTPEKAIIFELPQAVLLGKKETKSISMGQIKNMTIAQFSTHPDVVHVVFRMIHKLPYTVQPSDSRHLLTISFSTRTAATKETGTHVSTLPRWKNVEASRKMFSPSSPGSTNEMSVYSPSMEAKYSKLILARENYAKQYYARHYMGQAEPAGYRANTDPYVSMYWNHASLTAVVRQLAAKLHLNVMIDTAVKGTVTMDLKHVPATQALGMILALNGYGYRQVGNILVVAAPAKLEKIPTLMQSFGPTAVQVIPLINVKAASLAPTITSEFPEVQINIDSRMNALIVKGSVSAIRKVVALVSELDKPVVPPPPPPPLHKALIRLNYANVKTTIAELKDLFPPNVTVIEDPRLNGMLVVGSQYDINAIQSLISAIDVPQPQVMLAMQVVAVNITKSSDLGIQWPGALQEDFDENVPSATGALPTPSQNGNTVSTNSLGFYSFVRGNLGFQASLNFLITHSVAKVLGAPRVAVLNDKAAEILLGEKYPIVYYEPQAGVYQVQYINIGVDLKVTPHISPNGFITVKLNPVVSELGTQPAGAQGYPEIDTRQATTEVRVQNGQTIVIGGLLNEQTSTAISKVPLLGDIPIIGNLFKNTVKNYTKTDLVITVTPTLLKD